MSTVVVGRGVVGMGLSVGVDVNVRRDRKRESMMQRVFDVVGGVVSFLDRRIGVDGDRSGDKELVAMPSQPQIADITNPVDLMSGFSG